MLVSIIVLNWNGRTVLSQCLESIQSQTYSEFEVIVVDNGSKDGSIEMVERDFPDVVLLALNSNNGFCRGNNLGYEKSRGELIVLVNNDTELHPCFIEEVVAAARQNPQYAMFATRVWIHGVARVFDSTGLLVYPDGVCRSRGWLEADVGQYDDAREVLGPNGCAAVYRRSMLDDVGMFDEAYFAYLEDLDLAMRGRLRGWRCLYIPSAEASHKKSTTAGNHSAFKAYHVERNRIWNAIRLFPLRLLILSPAYTLARYLAQGYAAATNKGMAAGLRRDYSHGELVRILARAYRDAFARLPEVWRQRRVIQRHRRQGALDVYLLMRRYRLPLKELAFKD